MLEHLRRRVVVAMSQVETATLITCGPAGIQSDALPCRLHHLSLHLLVPRSSDQLLNLEHGDGVLVTAEGWQLRGTARLAVEADFPADCPAERLPEAAWSVWVVVTPLRLTLLDANNHRVETIDFEKCGGAK